MPNTGATGWDFLIAMRIPIWVICTLIIVGFCIMHADKLLSLSSAIYGFFAIISKYARKNQISSGIRSSVISASRKMNLQESNVLPCDLKIVWADNDDIDAFFDDNCVVVRLRQTTNPNENYINIIYQFVSSGLLKNQKHYFKKSVMDASSLLITRKIVGLSKPSANALFVEKIHTPQIENDEAVAYDYVQLERIDYNGMFFNIYLNELMKASSTIVGELPDPCLKAESGELLSFLYKIANRATSDEDIELTFSSTYFNIAIVLAASNDVLKQRGWGPHFRYAKKLFSKGYNTVYVFGIGVKADVAKKIAYAVKESEIRVVKSSTHEYRHFNVASGIRTRAICVELDTY